MNKLENDFKNGCIKIEDKTDYLELKGFLADFSFQDKANFDILVDAVIATGNANWICDFAFELEQYDLVGIADQIPKLEKALLQENDLSLLVYASCLNGADYNSIEKIILKKGAIEDYCLLATYCESADINKLYSVAKEKFDSDEESMLELKELAEIGGCPMHSGFDIQI